MISNGNTYEGFPFSVVPPGDNGETLSPATLTMSNVNLDISNRVRFISTPLTMNFTVVIASKPDEVQASFVDLTARIVTYNASAITFTLTYENIITLSFTAETYNRSNFPRM